MREGERALAHYVRKQPTSYICRERISAHTHSGSGWLAGWLAVRGGCWLRARRANEERERERVHRYAVHTANVINMQKGK